MEAVYEDLNQHLASEARNERIHEAADKQADSEWDQMSLTERGIALSEYQINSETIDPDRFAYLLGIRQENQKPENFAAAFDKEFTEPLIEAWKKDRRERIVDEMGGW